jgi:hypothetical protein
MTTINISIKDILGVAKITKVTFRLLAQITTEGVTLAPNTLKFINTDSAGLATIQLYRGNYFVQVDRSIFNISVSGTGTVNLVDLIALTPQEPLDRGVPSGGDTNQVLGKLSLDDFDFGWINQSGGGATNLTYTASPTQGQVNSDTGTDAIIPATDGTNAGLFLPTEKTKLTGIATNATANNSDPFLLDRNNHTGTQSISTIINLQSNLDSKQNTITNSDSITQGSTNLFLTTAERTKLSNTTNTNTGDETTGSILNKIGNGTVINDNYIPNTVARDSEILTKTLDTTFVPTNSAIVLGNTILQSLEKAQGQINNKENTITAGTTSQYWRGDKTFQTLDKTAVGLANVDNTSDLNKPISTATQTALNLKVDTTTLSSYETTTQLNTRDTNNRNRTNHTGTQTANTISDFASNVLATILTGLSTATNAVITTSDTVLSALGKLQKQVSDNLTTLTTHTSNTSNPHSTTKAQVGLGNVDNTTDLNKPISTATQTGLDAKANITGQVFTGNIQTPQINTSKQTLTPTGTTQSIDWNNGSIIDLVLSSATGNVILTLLNAQNASSYLIEVTNGATPRNLIFPTGTLQSNGGGNVYVGIANQKDIIAVLWDGTQFLISVSPNYA